MSPSPIQLQSALELVDRYIADDPDFNQEAWLIDTACYPIKTWTHLHCQRGLRRYLDYTNTAFTSHDGRRSEVRRSTVAAWSKRLNERLEDLIDSGWGLVPLTRALVEVGFTKDSDTRLRAHVHHQSSNYLTNLPNAVLQQMFPNCFGLQQWILHVCWQPAQCWLGEIYFTELCDSGLENARGFNHHAPGRSNGGSYRQGSIRQSQEWEAWGFQTLKPIERLQRERQATLSESLQSYGVQWLRDDYQAQEQVWQQERAQCEEIKLMIDLLDSMLALTHDGDNEGNGSGRDKIGKNRRGDGIQGANEGDGRSSE